MSSLICRCSIALTLLLIAPLAFSQTSAPRSPSGISIAPVSASVTEGTPAIFVITAEPPPADNLVVNIRLSGNDEFIELNDIATDMFVIPADRDSVTLTVPTDDDAQIERTNQGLISATLTAGTDYTLTSATAEVIVHNNDARIGFAETHATFTEGPDKVALIKIVVLEGQLPIIVVPEDQLPDADGHRFAIFRTHEGTAISPTDFSAITRPLHIPPNVRIAHDSEEPTITSVSVTIVDDRNLEPPEQFSATLTPSDSLPPGVILDSARTEITIRILDGEPRVSISTDLDSIIEGELERQALVFTVTAIPAPKSDAKDLDVNLSLSDTRAGMETQIFDITIPAGTTNRTITLMSMDNAVDDRDGRIIVTVEPDSSRPGKPDGVDRYLPADSPDNMAAITVRDDDLTTVPIGIPRLLRRKFQVELSTHFSDANNDPLTYTATSNDVRIIKAEIDRRSLSLLTLTPTASSGSAMITVTASTRNPEAETATQTFRVVVSSEISIAAVSASVTEGTPAAFMITVKPPPADDLTLGISLSGGEHFIAAGYEPPKTFVIPAGRSSTMLTVPTDDDERIEATNQGIISATLATGTTHTLIDAAAEVIVYNNDARIGFTQTEITATEGTDSTVSLRIVVLEGQLLLSAPYTINFHTMKNTAVDPTDFDAITRPLEILPDVRVAHNFDDPTLVLLDITIADDPMAEPAEHFSAILTPSGSLPPGITLDPARTMITILDNEPRVSILTELDSIIEGELERQDLVFTVTTMPAPAENLTVNLSFSDTRAGMETRTSEITIPAGTTNRTIALMSMDNAVDDRDGSLTVTVEPAVSEISYLPADSPDNMAAITLRDDDLTTTPILLPGLVKDMQEVDVSANFSDADGDTLSYTTTSDKPGVIEAAITESGLLTLTPTALSGSAMISVTASTQNPEAETATQTFIAVVSHELSIVPVSASVTEGTPAAFVVTVKPAPAEELTVNIRLSGGESFIPSDYERLMTFAIPADRDSVTLTVPTEDDIVIEATNHGLISATLTAGTDYTLTSTTAEVIVHNNDARIGFAETHATFMEGPDKVALIKIVVLEGQLPIIVVPEDQLPDADGHQFAIFRTLEGTAISPTDFSAITRPLHIPPNVRIAHDSEEPTITSVSITLVDDRAIEPPEQFSVTLTPSNPPPGVTLDSARMEITITILDGEPRVSISTDLDSIIEGELGRQTLVFTVTAIPAPKSDAKDLDVNLSLSDTRAGMETQIFDITIPAGTTNRTITLMSMDNAVDDRDGTLTVTVEPDSSRPGKPDGVDRYLPADSPDNIAAITLRDDDLTTTPILLPGLVKDMLEVDVSANFSDADADTLTYTAMSDNPGVIAATITESGLLTLTPTALSGGAMISVTASTRNPEAETATQTFIAVVSHELSIVPVSASVTEGTPAAFVVTVKPAPAEELTVSISLSGGESFIPSDYERLMTFAIPADRDSVTLTVPTEDDIVIEATNHGLISATLTAGTGYTLIDATAEVIVYNNDARIGFTETEITATEGTDSTVSIGIAVLEGQLLLPDTLRLVFSTEENSAISPTDFSTVTKPVPLSPDIRIAHDSDDPTITSVSITIANDPVVESPEQFFAMLTPAPSDSLPPGITLDPARTMITILDNEPRVSISTELDSIIEGELERQDLVFTVTAMPTPATNLTVSLSLSDTRAGMATRISEITIPTGTTNRTIALMSMDNAVDDRDGTLTVTVAPDAPGPGQPESPIYYLPAASPDNMAAITLRDDDLTTTPIDLELIQSTQEVDVSANFSDADNDTLTYSAESDNPDIVQVSIDTESGVLTLTPNASAGSAMISVTASTQNPETETATQTFRVVTSPEISIAAASASVTEGTPATFVITAEPPLTNALAVGINLNGGDSFILPGYERLVTFAIPADRASVTLTVPTEDDIVIEATNQGIISATLTAGTGYTLINAAAEVIVYNNDARIGFTQTEITATEGTDLTVSIEIAVLEGRLPTTLGFLLNTEGETADSPADFEAVTGISVHLSPDGQFLTQDDDNRLTISDPIAIMIVDDLMAEPAEHFSAILAPSDSLPPGITLNPAGTTITILDNEPRVSISTELDSIIEGELERQALGFTVTAMPAPVENLTVSLSLSDTRAGMATRISEITIPAGTTNRTITLMSMDNAVDDRDGTLTVTVEPAVSEISYLPADSPDNMAAITLRDDDLTTTPILLPGLVKDMLEVDVSANFSDADNDTLTYSAESDNPDIVQVSIGTEPGVLTLTPNALSGSAMISVTASTRNPEAETATQTFIAVVSHELSIVPVSASVTEGTPAASVTEGTPAAFVVTVKPAPAEELTVNIRLSGNDEFIDLNDIATDMFVIPADRDSVTLTVPTEDDIVIEATNHGFISATLTAGTGYTLIDATAEVIVYNNDARIGFTETEITATEGTDSTVSIGIAVLEGQLLLPDTLRLVFSTEENSAISPTDFSTVTKPVPLSPDIRIAHDSDDSTITSVSITIANDPVVESPEQFFAMLTLAPSDSLPPGITLDPARTMITILDNEPRVSISTELDSIIEGELERQDLVFTVTAMPTPATNLTVSLSLSDTRAGMATRTSEITIPAGTTNRTIALMSMDNAVDDRDGTLTVTVAPDAPGPGQPESPIYYLPAASPDNMAAITLRDDDLTTTPIDIPELIQGTQEVDVSANFSDADADTLTYRAESDNPDIVQVSIDTESGVLTLTPNASAGSAMISVTASTQNPETETATQTFRVVTSPEISIAAVSASVTEGTPATFVVTIKPPPANDLTVNIRLSDGDGFIAAGYKPPGTLVIPAGRASTMLTVPTEDDIVIEPTNHGLISAMLETVTTHTLIDAAAEVIVYNNDARIGFTQTEITATEGTDLTVSIEIAVLEGRLPTTLGFLLDTEEETADSPADFEAVTGISVHLSPDGQFLTQDDDNRLTISDPIAIMIVDDLMAEPAEHFVAMLTLAPSDSLPPGITLDPAGTMITILDNEPRVSISTELDSIIEGELERQDLVFTVTAMPAPVENLTVNLSFSDTRAGMATRTSEITIPAGTTNRTIALMSMDNTVDDRDGTLTVTVEPDSLRPGDTEAPIDYLPAASPDNIAAITLRDDDLTTTPIGIPRLIENKFQIDVSANFSDADADTLTYSAESDNPGVIGTSINTESGLLTLTPNASVGSAVISVTASTQNPEAETATQTFRVVTSPEISIAAASASVTEGTPAAFVITAEPPLTNALAVGINLSGGDSFILPGYERLVTFAIPADRASVTLTVPTEDDIVIEATNQGIISATLTAGTGYTLIDTAAEVIVYNNDARIGFAQTEITATEGTDPTVSLRIVVLEGQVLLSDPYTINFHTMKDTAVDPADFDAITRPLEIPPDVRVAHNFDDPTLVSIDVTIADDSVAEPAERFSAIITQGGTALGFDNTEATITILDNEPRVSISTELDSIIEGELERQALVFTVTAMPAPTENLTVNLSFSDTRPDTAPQAMAITIPANTANHTITLMSMDNASDDRDGSLTVTVEPAVSEIFYLPADSPDDEAAITLRDDDLTTTPIDITRLIDREFQVDVSANFSDADGDRLSYMTRSDKPDVIEAAITESGRLTLTPNALSGSAMISVTATGNPEAETATQTFRAVVSHELSIAAVSASVTEGTPAIFVITAEPPPTNDLIVNISLSGGDGFIDLNDMAPDTLAIPAGKTSAKLTVPTEDDIVIEPQGIISATLTAGTGYTLIDAAAEIIVYNNDARIGFTRTAISLTEGTEVPIAIAVLEGRLPTTLRLLLSTEEATATEPEDFRAVTGISVHLSPDGQFLTEDNDGRLIISAPIAILIVDDSPLAEPSEHFSAVLTPAPSESLPRGVTLDPARTTITIVASSMRLKIRILLEGALQ